jgi:hypothetical protein
MKGALIILLFTVALGVILYIFDRLYRRKYVDKIVQQEDSPAADSEGCCGRHIVCEKVIDQAFAKQVVYYDDEELDRFSGREPGDYTDAEVEEFRDILLTMRPSDIDGWCVSLSRRNICVPQEIRDEMLIILADANADS